MKIGLAALAVLALASGCVVFQAAGVNGARVEANASSVADEIRALEAGWSRAFLEGDYAFLERIVAPEYVLASSFNGQTDFTPRHEWMANSRKFQFREYETTVRDVIVAGDTAVATLDGRWLVSVPGIDKPRDDRFYVTDTWARRKGQWQVIFRHSGPPTKR